MYDIEILPVSQLINGVKRWFTPTEAKEYYGRYSREGITIHWWGDGTGADNHDNIVNFFKRRTDGSVNYVLSDNKITMMVNPDNAAFCSQSGNATTVSIEHQPTLGAEGYKKSGWLVWQLEGRYGKRLTLYPHNHWFATQCPGTIDISRIRAEADKWAAGGYDAPAPVPPPQITLKVTDIPNKAVRLIKDANLWDLHFDKYVNAKVVKSFKAGEIIEDVSAIAEHPLGSKYYLTQFSFEKGIGNGINVKDCEDFLPPLSDPHTPPPTPPEPTPVVIPVLTGSEYDKQQDEEINGIKSLLQKIADFLSSLFNGFKKG